MVQSKFGAVKTLAGLLLAVALFAFTMPGAVFSQQQTIQDMVVNGGFEGGFQDEFGVGYGWGGFSNGNAVVGWNGDSEPGAIAAGQYSQRIEIKEALDHDRYAGIYQTISVVPGEQYKLTIKGMVRSEEGDVSVSDYGYRLQFAVDYNGDTAWELLDPEAWQELPWDEQPLTLSGGASHRLDSFDTTITSKTDRLTLFIRGWKKWIDNGSGVFNLDQISLTGPAPEGFQSPVAQLAVAGEAEPAEAQPEIITVSDAAPAPAEEAEAEAQPAPAEAQPQVETQPEAQPEAAPEPALQQTVITPLPATGSGDDHSLIFVVGIGSLVLLALFVSAITATIRRNSVTE
ncbi:MAG: hypothetical protein Kow0031_19350 [Anaerolineae bacterium]